MDTLLITGSNLKILNAKNFNQLHAYKSASTNSIRDFTFQKETSLIALVNKLNVANKENLEVVNVTSNTLDHFKKLKNCNNIGKCAFFKTRNYNLLLASDKGEIFHYDLKGGKILKSFDSNPMPISQIDCNSNDTHLAAAYFNSGEIILYSLVNYIKSSTLKVNQNKNDVCTLKFNETKRTYLATGDEGGILSVWDINKNRRISKFNEHTSICTMVNFSPINHSLAASVSYDMSFKLYDINSKKVVYSKFFTKPLTSFDFSSDGNFVALSSMIGNVYVMDLRNGNIIFESKLFDEEITKIMYAKISNKKIELDFCDNDSLDSKSETNLSNEINEENNDSFLLFSKDWDWKSLNKNNDNGVDKNNCISMDQNKNLSFDIDSAEKSEMNDDSFFQNIKRFEKSPQPISLSNNLQQHLSKTLSSTPKTADETANNFLDNKNISKNTFLSTISPISNNCQMETKVFSDSNHKQDLIEKNNLQKESTSNKKEPDLKNLAILNGNELLEILNQMNSKIDTNNDDMKWLVKDFQDMVENNFIALQLSTAKQHFILNQQIDLLRDEINNLKIENENLREQLSRYLL